MGIVNASIITIGDELLIGQTIDTNSAFVARELNNIGIWVRRRVAVGDDYDEIWDALDEESELSDIIILTGGLGPTADDITKPLLCDYFGGKLVVNNDVLAHVKLLFEKIYRRPGPILDRNLKQAEVPDNCIVLHNARGTAPGMWFRTSAPPAHRRGGLKPQTLKKHTAYSGANPMAYGLLKEFVERHRKNPTEAERILWTFLSGKKMAGFKFRRLHIIDEYITDFICFSKNLIIEIDGLHHQLPENKKSNNIRTAHLNNLGFKVIRFTNKQVIFEIENVIELILSELKKENSKSTESQIPPSGDGGAVFISLPGVPHEMKGLMLNEVIPRIQKEFELPAIVHKTAFTAGQGESVIAEMLKDFEPSLPAHIKLAYLPNYGMVKLRLTSRGPDKESVEKEMQPYFDRMLELVKDCLVTNRDEGLEQVIGNILRGKNKTMGTAESCTGGYIAHLITSVPGSSAYFKGSVVGYANEVKENILGVAPATLAGYGAVSKETVTEMVRGALQQLHVDYALATSGIMGPDGGSPEKPVGTVWIAAGHKDKVVTQQLNLRFDRERNISMTASAALNFLRKFILAEP